MPVPTGDSPAATPPATTVSAATAATASAATTPATAASATAATATATAATASAATTSAATAATAATARDDQDTARDDHSVASPRTLFIVLVLGGVLLPFPVGPLSVLGAAFVALRNRMRPWIPAVLVAGAIALTAPALTR